MGGHQEALREDAAVRARRLLGVSVRNPRHLLPRAPRRPVARLRLPPTQPNLQGATGARKPRRLLLSDFQLFLNCLTDRILMIRFP